jgi:hypothetical protein
MLSERPFLNKSTRPEAVMLITPLSGRVSGDRRLERKKLSTIDGAFPKEKQTELPANAIVDKTF